VLLPLFHYIPLSMVDSDLDIVHSRWNAYVKFNRAFADTVLSIVKPNDLVWIHDYYLMLLPAMLREVNSPFLLLREVQLVSSSPHDNSRPLLPTAYDPPFPRPLNPPDLPLPPPATP
jgi:hypothetical protein